MDHLYGAITIALIVTVAVRAPTLKHSPYAWPAWVASALAIPALLSRGSFIPIQTLDGWMGNQNIIFLVQCWFATFALWALCEAAEADPNADRRAKLKLWVPYIWCCVFTIPFFLIRDRTGTDLFFIDAKIDDPAAIVCGVLYIGGFAAICARHIWRLRGRRAPAFWLFRAGTAMMGVACILWGTAIVLDHTFALHRTPIVWMYEWFDYLFYPGIVVVAAGLMTFAAQRIIRNRPLRRMSKDLHAILTHRSIKASTINAGLSYRVYDLLVHITDLQGNGTITLTHAEEQTLMTVRAWVEDHLPQLAKMVDRHRWSE